MEMSNRDNVDSVRKTMSAETQTELTLPTLDTNSLKTQTFTFYLYKENENL